MPEVADGNFNFFIRISSVHIARKFHFLKSTTSRGGGGITFATLPLDSHSRSKFAISRG